MIEVPIGVFAAVLAWVFCLGWVVCSNQHRVVSDGETGDDSDQMALPLDTPRVKHPRSALELTPKREARLRALNPHFAKAQDQTKASDAWAEKIRSDLTGCKTQAAQQETAAKGSVVAMTSPSRKA